MPDDLFSRALASYIEGCRNLYTEEPPIVIATHANDFELLRDMLAFTAQTPPYSAELRYSESLIDNIRVAFASDPELLKRRHHALVDARVLQKVYRSWFNIGKSRTTDAKRPPDDEGYE